MYNLSRIRGYATIYFFSAGLGAGGAPESSGFIAGKSSTSLMFALFVKNMVRRSTPMPQRPVGGSACSRATTKSSSCI